MHLHYTINLPPVTKKNSQQVWRHGQRLIVAPSKPYKAYEDAAVCFLVPRPKVPLLGPVEVRTVFYMPTRRRVDLTNLMEAIHDVLVKAGILVDDNSQVVVSVDGSRVMYDKDHPRTEIDIIELQEDTTWQQG